MAAIREELVLADRFSDTFSRFLRMGREAEQILRRLGGGQGGYNDAVRRSTAALEEMANASRRSNELLERMGQDMHALRNGSNGAAGSQERLNRSFRDGSSAANGLLGKLRNLAAAYLGLRSAQKFVKLSDTWTQTTARLKRMNDGQQTTPEVQDMIYQAAQRSRGDYQDTANLVAKLGTLAGDAFGSTAEVVAFAEQINKQFALAGTSAQGAQAAMLQLTQAMGSGVLRGEELNSILEQAPTITKAIADYLGVSVGKMRDLAKEGELTAGVVKAAVFAAAKETDAAFEAVPLTFSQAWTMIKNEAVNAFRPAMEQLNGLLNTDTGRAAVNGLIAAVRALSNGIVGLIGLVKAGADWVLENWETVSTALIAGAVGIAAVMTASAVRAAAAWAMVNWPLLLLVGGIALVIYGARQMGATWEEIGGMVAGVFGTMYAAFMNLFAVPLQNAAASLINFICNAFHDLGASLKILFFDVAQTILGYLSSVAHGIETLINSIPGMSLSITSRIDGLYNQVQSASQRVKDASGWKEYVKPWDYVDYGENWNKWSAKGRNIGSSLDHFQLPDYMSGIGGTPFNYDEILTGVSGQLEDIGKDTKSIKNSVSLSEEDLKLLVDLAEREYITNVNLTAQTPVITINNQTAGNNAADSQHLANVIKTILIEQAASHTDLAYT